LYRLAGPRYSPWPADLIGEDEEFLMEHRKKN